ncbi:hypothetical protein KSMBR1_2036 [Candidatus Kuenenia stuttgartiensis]|nr:hypothetical protein KSMBR1_2036 [Candidatus Kuenenia stuttgartiensis]
MGVKNFWIDLLNFNGDSPQVKKQKCRRSIVYASTLPQTHASAYYLPFLTMHPVHRDRLSVRVQVLSLQPPREEHRDTSHVFFTRSSNKYGKCPLNPLIPEEALL